MGSREKRREMEGGQMELCSQTSDSLWEDFRWGALFLFYVCVLGSVCVLTGLSCYGVNHSASCMNLLFVYFSV